MSAGAFTISKYESDSGTIYPIRVQPETLTANLGSANAAPAGTVDGTVLARARKNRRGYGVGARTVRVRFTGAAPDDYAPNQTLSIPVLTPDVFNAIIPNSTTGTYLGAAILVIGKSPESVR